METEDPQQMLAQISGRARKKAVRRALIGTITLVPGVAVAAVGIFTLGSIMGVAAGVLVAVTIAIALEKLLPSQADE